MNRRIDELLGPFEGFFVCPHAPEDACECRKPKPKLILDAARALGVASGCCVVVGDRESDVRGGAQRRRDSVRSMVQTGSPTSSREAVE